MIITAKGQEHHELLDLMDAVRQIYSDSKIIIVGCLASWVLCRLNFSFVWLLLILACCRTQYGLYIRRVKRVVRDEIYRYEARKTLQQGESVEWVNTIVGKLWHLYERRLCDELVRYINAELARKVDVEHNPQKVVIHSLEVIERPLRITKVKAYSKPNTPNFILEAYFLVDIEPIHGHQHLHFLEVPLVDMSIVHERPNRDHHDLSVQVRQFTGSGTVQLEFDFQSMHPHLLQPHLEIQEKPEMDCTIRTISHHHFPFHFAHHVDWRNVVERQIREGLKRTFHQPLPLPFNLLGEGLMFNIMRGLWYWKRYQEGL